jgi:hypothetical protein
MDRLLLVSITLLVGSTLLATAVKPSEPEDLDVEFDKLWQKWAHMAGIQRDQGMLGLKAVDHWWHAMHDFCQHHKEYRVYLPNKRNWGPCRCVPAI